MADTLLPESPAALRLDDAHLPDLPSRVAPPGYDRSALTPAVVHIGVGGFHRAHQAVYLDDLARVGETGWGLTGVGLRRPEMGEVLTAQDCLYLAVERAADEDRARVVGVMGHYLFAPDSPEAVLDVLSDERTRLVTLTITGTGYLVDAHTGTFEPDDDVRRDLQEPSRPRTAFGYLVEALDRRRRTGSGPFTILSCDNLPDNGAAARTAVVSFARLRDPALGDWIDEQVTFPSCMVDRITPNTSPAQREAIVADFGVEDRWPVIAEPFRRWVVEDSFCNGRPPLERVGVQLVDDVAPYQQMKTRLLNGAHTALGHLGYLAGHRTTCEVMADPVFRGYLVTMMDQEIVPLLPPVPGIDLADYQRTLVERLTNPRMADQLARLSSRGATKIPAYLLPSVREALRLGRPHELLSLAVAGWMRFLRGYDDAGVEVPADEPRPHLVQVARACGSDPRPLLAERDVFGDLGRDPRLVATLTAHLRLLDERGPRQAVELCLRATERNLQ